MFVIPSAREGGAHSGIQHQTHCLRIIKEEDGIQEALGASSDSLSTWNFGRPWAALLASTMSAETPLQVSS